VSCDKRATGTLRLTLLFSDPLVGELDGHVRITPLHIAFGVLHACHEPDRPCNRGFGRIRISAMFGYAKIEGLLHGRLSRVGGDGGRNPLPRELPTRYLDVDGYLRFWNEDIWQQGPGGMPTPFLALLQAPAIGAHPPLRRQGVGGVLLDGPGILDTGLTRHGTTPGFLSLITIRKVVISVKTTACFVTGRKRYAILSEITI
jgi:hypothetical protein